MTETAKHIQVLEFEKPLYKIHDKIEELKKTSADTHIDYRDEIKKLEEQTKVYRKELYEKETNKYSKNYLELSNKLSELRIKLEAEPLVKKYHEYEKEINDYLESLRIEMLKAVRGEK